jgi:hypothetical protein
VTDQNRHRLLIRCKSTGEDHAAQPVRPAFIKVALRTDPIGGRGTRSSVTGGRCSLVRMRGRDVFSSAKEQFSVSLYLKKKSGTDRSLCRISI